MTRWGRLEKKKKRENVEIYKNEDKTMDEKT